MTITHFRLPAPAGTICGKRGERSSAAKRLVTCEPCQKLFTQELATEIQKKTSERNARLIAFCAAIQGKAEP